MKFLYKIASFICVMGILSACATPDYNYRPISLDISKPPLNTVQKAFVGDKMLLQGKYTEIDAIKLENPIDIGWSYTLLPGFYLKKGEDSDTETYLPSQTSDGGAIDKAALADQWSAIMAYKNEDKICVITVLNAFTCANNASFERTKKPSLTSDSFQQTLIYSGRVGEKINVSYREFSNNVARPAFNNEVEYDLSNSDMIAYKGAKIRIISATNEFIKYEVLSNFNSAPI